MEEREEKTSSLLPSEVDFEGGSGTEAVCVRLPSTASSLQEKSHRSRRMNFTRFPLVFELVRALNLDPQPGEVPLKEDKVASVVSSTFSFLSHLSIPFSS